MSASNPPPVSGDVPRRTVSLWMPVAYDDAAAALAKKIGGEDTPVGHAHLAIYELGLRHLPELGKGQALAVELRELCAPHRRQKRVAPKKRRGSTDAVLRGPK